MSDTIFGKILDGEIPCHRVYEDDDVLAFLDINPLSFGHVLVIPRERVARLHELSDRAAAGLGRALPRIARAVLAASGASDYNVLQNNGAAAGQEVDHVHVHIIPKFDDSGLQKRWTPGTLTDDHATTLLERMHGALRGGVAEPTQPPGSVDQ